MVENLVADANAMKIKEIKNFLSKKDESTCQQKIQAFGIGYKKNHN